MVQSDSLQVGSAAVVAARGPPVDLLRSKAAMVRPAL
jgi:hypothetical protein